MEKRRETVFMFDFDGTIVNTMGLHGKLAADVMHKHFGIERKEAKERYYSTTGIPFHSQIKKIFPRASAKALKACAEEYMKRKNKEVFEKADLFPDTKKTLEKLKKKGHELVISSSTEEKMIKKILARKGIDDLFSEVYGCDSGSKKDHINKVMKERRPDTIVFTGDSRSDVKFSDYDVISVGRAGKNGGLSVQELMDSGADSSSKGIKRLTNPGFVKGTLLLKRIKEIGNKKFTIFRRKK